MLLCVGVGVGVQHIHTSVSLSFHFPAWDMWTSKKERDRNSKSRPTQYQDTPGLLAVVIAQLHRNQRINMNLAAACMYLSIVVATLGRPVSALSADGYP